MRWYRGGIALLETSVLIAAIALVAVTIMKAFQARWTAAQADRELSLARAALASKAAAMEAIPFDKLFRCFNPLPHDDPEGPFTAPGSWFEAPGLESAGPQPGRIEFPVDSIGQLKESLSVPWAGMPRDLNGDRVIDTADRSGDYRLLPVRLVVEWRGALGTRRIEQVLFFQGR